MGWFVPAGKPIPLRQSRLWIPWLSGTFGYIAGDYPDRIGIIKIKILTGVFVIILLIAVFNLVTVMFGLGIGLTDK